MNLKKNLQLKIINNLFNNKKFYISDIDKKINFNQIKERFDNFNSNTKIKKIKNKKVLSVICNKSGLSFWSNFLICFLNNYTVMPVDKDARDYNKIKKFYDYIVIFKENKFKIIKNKKKITNKYFNEIDYISSTSGSTGQSKMILLSFDSIIINSKYVIKYLNYVKGKNFLVAIPFYFNSAICHFFTCIINEMNFLSYERLLFPFNLNQIINKYEVNYFGGAPVQVQWILNFKKIKNSFQKVVSSGDFLNKENIKKYLKEFKSKFELYNIYGVTELGGRVFINNIKNSTQPFSLGKNLTFQKKKLKKISKNIYEIGIESPYAFKGYFANKLQKNILSKKIFYTNDLVSRNKNNLELIGRKNEIFKSSGIKVFPELIKKQILKYSLINNVYIYPFYFSKYGTVPVAAYESKKEIKPNKIFKFLENKLSKNQIPKKFIWFKKLPLLKNKKIDKQKIKNMKF